MKTNVELATAFALGAAAAATIFKARSDRRRKSEHKSACATPDTDYRNRIEVPPIPGNALEPLNTDVLVKRSVEAFPAGYLLLISIIQSVTLGLLLTAAVTLLAKPITPVHFIAIVSKTATLFGALVIISYEYLWFVVMMRWASTFRDTLIPYAIGLSEIIPCLMLDQSLSWWVAATAIPAASGAALFNTITRLDRRAFIDKPDVYRRVRLLLWHIIMCCIAIVIIGITASILLYIGVLQGILMALAPITLILPALLAVGINEKGLNSIFEAYGVSRRPLPWPS